MPPEIAEPPIVNDNQDGSNSFCCLNCGEAVPQNYCPNCGQEKTACSVSAAHLLHDAYDEFFKLDSKLGKTIIPLLTRPGKLTNEYLAGRRVRYVSPFRLYFIVSAIYFLCFSFAHYDVTVMRALALTVEQAHPSQISSANSTAMEQHHHDASQATSNSQIEPSQTRAMRHHVALDKTSMWFIKNQSLITFLLVPVAAMLLKLLYVKTRVLYVDHLVFAVHVQTFLFMMLLPALIPIARNVTYIASLLASCIYLFIAMRVVYRDSPLATGLKCVVMLGSYVVLMGGICLAAFLLFYYA